MDFENNLEIGIGVYTTSEISNILRLPYSKVHRWINKYWDGELGREYENRYSWSINNSKAVSFHTLIEFYVMMGFAEAGVKTRKVLKAHKELSKMYDSAFPFALKDVLMNIKTDGKTIYLNSKLGTISLDGTKQFNLNFINLFFKNLEFNSNEMASRFWPIGKEKSIIVDPERKFGHPVVDGRNIYPETIFKNFKGGDSKKYLAYVYDLTEEQIDHALEYCNVA